MSKKQPERKSKVTSNRSYILPPQIRERLRRTHGTSAELARLAGVGTGYVSEVLRGKRNCNKKLFDAITLYLRYRGYKAVVTESIHFTDHHEQF